MLGISNSIFKLVIGIINVVSAFRHVPKNMAHQQLIPDSKRCVLIAGYKAISHKRYHPLFPCLPRITFCLVLNLASLFLHSKPIN